MTDQQTPPQEAGFFTTVRGWGLARGDERVLGGVASGIAARLGWRLGWTRVGVLAVVLLVSGLGALAYAAAWALLPDREGRIIAQDFGRGVPNVGALIMIGIIALAGLLGLANAGDGPFGWAGGWPVNGAWDGPGHSVVSAIATVAAVAVPLLIVGGIVGLIVWLVRRDRTPRPDDGTPPVYAAPPAWAAERQQRRAAAHAEAYAAADAARAAGQEAADTARAAAQDAAAAATAATAWTASTPPPVAPAAPPRPPRPPRVPGPGAGFHLLTLAWLVLSAAGTAWAGWNDRLAVHPVLAWFALFVTGLGVILALVALSGRRLGSLAFLSAVLLVPTAVMIVQADKVVEGWSDRWLPRVEVIRGDGGEVVRVEVGDGTLTVGEDGDVTLGDPEAVETAEPELTEASVLDKFDTDYQRIMLPGDCYASREALDASGMSVGLVDESLMDADQTVDVTAGYTTVRIPRGTGLAIATDDSSYSTVHWVERGVTCEVWDGSPVSLAATDQPTLTLKVANPEGYASIVIEEAAS
ncbi:PspC domain-containing protein [Demequina sp. SYSU T00039]|uniref:PspC domain-containing protein n=1 Tax=Demequina lignilytica TaxID=3051663 RepID=A0AAW7M3K9_9MICO|nr:MULTISPECIES: PspC domain-containing protein [unclassified Demequina]MDN4478181.1 PspC domain-containing protein [Demequina sp. SYSU T00039-1]MDN4488369.1 PspC domain-containing protein [Demequina sp. SYSU T00039]